METVSIILQIAIFLGVVYSILIQQSTVKAAKAFKELADLDTFKKWAGLSNEITEMEANKKIAEISKELQRKDSTLLDSTRRSSQREAELMLLVLGLLLRILPYQRGTIIAEVKAPELRQELTAIVNNMGDAYVGLSFLDQVMRGAEARRKELGHKKF